MIAREEIIKKYSPILHSPNLMSPMILGNGSFAFSADITGLQTLYFAYRDKCPLLTMAEWGWHTAPFGQDGERYPKLDELPMTEYIVDGKKYLYPVEETEDNRELYNWLRENPHKMNLARIAFEYKGKGIEASQLLNCTQKLDMYTGTLMSRFYLDGEVVHVTTSVAQQDVLGIKVESKLLKSGLTIGICLPYGEPSMEAGSFEKQSCHTSELSGDFKTSTRAIIRAVNDRDEYFMAFNGEIKINNTAPHCFDISSRENTSSTLKFTVAFAKKQTDLSFMNFREVVENSRKRWYTYWNTGAMIDVSTSKDERADELERRIVTSMYLMAAQEGGKLPPAETGLTCNSWYGKFHLEMHPIHDAWLALYGRGSMLENSLAWYIEHLDEAKANASRNGFKGARWPKMVGPDGIDSPSVIAPLLIWQQPHIIYMLELLYLSRYRSDRVEVPNGESAVEFIGRYSEVIRETAAFMADFPIYNSKKGVYELRAPLIPAQENHSPLMVLNPTFELGYWSFSLRTAFELMNIVGERHEEWLRVADAMAPLPVKNGLLLAHENCETTYVEFNHDHPSMLFACGFLPMPKSSDGKDNGLRAVFEASLGKTLECWDMDSLWGWDFAFMAMTAEALGLSDLAFDILLKDTAKNMYVINGNNAQGTRKDLPLYLPGNGSLLLAMTSLSSTQSWNVVTEGLMKYPWNQL